MNWESYKQSISKLSDKEKGDSFEQLTKWYLQYEPQYCTKLKKVWLLSEVPSKIHKKLNLPSQDQGIDLICETKDGEYWAVQSKYHEDEATNQTWKSLSTFTGLAFGICNNISFGLVCTTAERFTKTLKNQDNIGFCTSEIWQQLDEEFFKSFLKKRKPKKIKPYKPFPHQKRAIKNAFSYYLKDKNSRGKMIMPCGAGKSLTAFWIAEKLDANRIIVAVPSLNLIRQTLKAWLRESTAKGWEVDWITVCSDSTVGELNADDLVVLKQDLGIPAITDPKIIAQFLRKRHKGKVVVFTTYQSGKAIAEASKISQRNFDLGIMDEAHKTVGAKDKSFAHLLLDKNIKIKKRVFMTATERRYLGVQEKILSMDDPNIYGNSFDFLSFKEALKQEPPILSDYRIITVMVSNQEIAELIKTGKFIQPSRGKWNKEVEADTFASLVALRKAMKKYNIKHSISFHGNIARAKAYQENQEIFSSLFPKYGKLESFHVSGKMPTSQRAAKMKDFEKSKAALITNARCLTEGIDVPAIDCVLFADPKQSTIDIVQAVGRALRLYSGKKFGYIIVPVVIDNEAERFEGSKAYQSILMTLRALASNDERIIDYFRDKANKIRTKKLITIDFPPQLAKEINEKLFVRDLELKVWNKLARLSWMPFQEARTFVRNLKLKGTEEWFDYTKSDQRPKDIPVAPSRIYKDDGWISMGDWLGTGTVAPQNMIFRPFQEARTFARNLKLKGTEEWFDYTKSDQRPKDIPVAPSRIYKDDGWISYSDWLGSKRLSILNKKPFLEARKFVRTLNLKSQTEWKKYCEGELEGYIEKPEDIPKTPNQAYKNDGWISMGDWLGTGTVAPQNMIFRPFSEARKFVRLLNIKSQTEWKKYCKGELEGYDKKPINIPTNPNQIYKNVGWISMSDWLGTGTVATRLREYRPYHEAQKFSQSLNLSNQYEWFDYTRGKLPILPLKPSDIPTDPRKVYLNKGWTSWLDWLGTRYWSFAEARDFARDLNLKSVIEWKKYCKGELEGYDKKPINIPNNPNQTYKNVGWKNYPDFLGFKAKPYFGRNK